MIDKMGLVTGLETFRASAISPIAFVALRYGTAQRQRRKRTQLFAIYERVSSVTSAF